MIKTAIKKFLVTTMSYKIFQWCRKNRVIILMYHGFYDEDQAEGIEQYGSRWCGINEFKKQINYLKRHYNIISLDLLNQYCTKGTELPGNSVIITMDDGYESNYSLAYPYLKQQNIPFSIFITTDFIDNGELLWADQVDYKLWKYPGKSLTLELDNKRVLDYSTADDNAKINAAINLKQELQSASVETRKSIVSQIEQAGHSKNPSPKASTKLQAPLTWDQVQTLSRDPLVSIGSHTVTHPNLTTCTDDKLDFELNKSRHRIEEKIGANYFCPVFCYPGGAHDRRVHTFVEQAGYSSALAVGLKSIPKNFLNRYSISRVGIKRDLTLNEMIFKLCTC